MTWHVVPGKAAAGVINEIHDDLPYIQVHLGFRTLVHAGSLAQLMELSPC